MFKDSPQKMALVYEQLSFLKAVRCIAPGAITRKVYI